MNKEARNFCKYVFLHNLSNVPKLTKFKLLQLGFNAVSVSKLVRDGYLKEIKDENNRICYYSVDLSKFEK